MERPSFNFDDHVPVYRQLCSILREKIGVEWRLGHELPSEGALAAEFRVNRHTIRRAISVLTDDGLLQRRRGQRAIVVHTTVAKRPKIEAAPGALFGMRPKTRFQVIGFARQPLPPEVARHLELNDAEHGYRLDRLLIEGTEALAYVLAYLPEQIGDLLGDVSLEKATVSSILTTRFGLTINTAHQCVEAVLAEATIARALAIPPGVPLLKCRYILRGEPAKPLILATYFYRADRYQFTFEVTANADPPAHGATRLESWPLRVSVVNSRGTKRSR